MDDPRPTSSPSSGTTDEKLDAILGRLDALDVKSAERRFEWLKLGIPSAIATITIVVGFVQYVSTSSFTVRSPYLTKQTELCLLASEQTARLASSTDKGAWGKARDEFWMLYLGPLAVVEEAGVSPVAGRMFDFGHQLEALGLEPALPATSLRNASLAVAHACRDLLSYEWQAGLLKWFGRR